MGGDDSKSSFHGSLSPSMLLEAWRRHEDTSTPPCPSCTCTPAQTVAGVPGPPKAWHFQIMELALRRYALHLATRRRQGVNMGVRPQSGPANRNLPALSPCHLIDARQRANPRYAPAARGLANILSASKTSRSARLPRPFSRPFSTLSPIPLMTGLS
jgi:hypothetical protein